MSPGYAWTAPLAVASIVFFVMFFGLGMGPIPWLLPSEVLRHVLLAGARPASSGLRDCCNSFGLPIRKYLLGRCKTPAVRKQHLSLHAIECGQSEQAFQVSAHRAIFANRTPALPLRVENVPIELSLQIELQPFLFMSRMYPCAAASRFFPSSTARRAARLQRAATGSPTSSSGSPSCKRQRRQRANASTLAPAVARVRSARRRRLRTLAAMGC
eukprot:4497459-Pleurochrysis_carterae.AAC.4